MEAKGWGLDLIARIESKERGIRKGDGKRVMKKVWERSGKEVGKIWEKFGKGFEWAKKKRPAECEPL